jgi:hypothetical protein
MKKMNGPDIQVGIPRREWKKRKEGRECSEYFNAFFLINLFLIW